MAATTLAERSEAVTTYALEHVLDSSHWALPFYNIHLPPWLSLHMVMLVVGAVLLSGIFALAFRKKSLVPHGAANALEVMVKFVRDGIAIENLGEEDGRKMAPLLCSFFFFILFLNLMGLIPLFATATGNVNVTAGLSLITLGVMIFGAIYKNGLGGFLKAFIPHGVPWPVLILLVPIEFMGMFIKTFALTIRLFANMFAGHIVIFSLIGLVVTYGWVALPAIGLALAIYILEILVALIQAYVFTLLSAMFIAQVHHPAH
ncbi:MAG: F0F1 ATP synthase subunit A [Kiritimatiellae bacterium]|nr:F0F1 ATP synthase subunit A [Kiritimatiellia bacterium]